MSAVPPRLALEIQAEVMCAKGIGSFAGLQRHRQQRIELVGGGGDGELLTVGHSAPLKDRFVARGQYDDGTGVEKAVYVKRVRFAPPDSRLSPAVDGDLPDVTPVVFYLYDGVPE